MRGTRVLAGALLLLLLAVAAGAEDRNLLSVVADLGAVLEWDPLRDAGVISFGDDRISLGVGAPMALINYRTKVSIDPPQRREGTVWLSVAAVTAISDAVQKDRLAHAAEHMRVGYILIDPGHGGKDGGGVGSFMEGKKQVTVKEKDVTLSVANRLAARLRRPSPTRRSSSPGPTTPSCPWRTVSSSPTRYWRRPAKRCSTSRSTRIPRPSTGRPRDSRCGACPPNTSAPSWT